MEEGGSEDLWQRWRPQVEERLGLMGGAAEARSCVETWNRKWLGRGPTWGTRFLKLAMMLVLLNS